MTEELRSRIGAVGVVGLGNMGIEIAARVAATAEVIGTDLSGDRRREAAARGIEVGDLASLQRCEVVLLSLPTPRASHAIAAAIAEAPGSVRIVLEMSTVTPADMLRTQQILRSASIETVDAAVLAGVAQMRAGTAGLVLAGDRTTIDELEPILSAITPDRRVLDGVGAGMAAKVLNNAVAHAVMVLLGEVTAMAVRSGLDPRVLVDILAGADGGLMRPLTHRLAERGFSGDYAGGMSLEAARKDSVLALEMAQESATPIFTLPAAHAVYEMAMAQGWARDDYAGLLRLWEGWGGFQLPTAIGTTP